MRMYVYMPVAKFPDGSRYGGAEWAGWIMPGNGIWDLLMGPSR